MQKLELIRSQLLLHSCCPLAKTDTNISVLYKLTLLRIYGLRQHSCNLVTPKGDFFSESAMCFSISKSPEKNIPKNILSLKFKFQVQDSFFVYVFFEIWRFEKHIALSEKKPPLVQSNCCAGYYD